MATKKTAKKKAPRKKKRKLADDPPIIVGGGGGGSLVLGTLISIPKGTPKTTVGSYDVYHVAWDVKTIVKKNSKNGAKQKSNPSDNGWEVQFWQSDF